MNFKRLFFLLSLIPLILLLSTSWLGAEVKIPWFTPLDINFYLKVDHLSLIFIYLTALIIPVCIFAVDKGAPLSVYGLILALQLLLLAFFSSRDLVFFVFFWEAMLIPLYLLINLGGGPQRKAAAMKFLIYMVAGSALMVAGVVAIYLTAHSFDLDQLSSRPYVLWIFLVFMLAFAVKTPLFPFHGWLPDAYVLAPTSSTLLLSALLSKAGIYGFLRIGWELFPEHLKAASPILLGLAVAGVLYGALVAWRQTDYKRLIAYSSLSHVNFILAGVFVVNIYAQEGVLLQSVNHSVTIAALFLVAGWLEERIGTTELGAYGLCHFMPRLCWFTLFFVMSAIALPGLNNFAGEVLILLGVLGVSPLAAALMALTVILSVMYLLRFMQYVYFGPSGRLQGEDIGLSQVGILLPLVAIVLWIGLYPAPLLKFMEPAVKRIEK